MGVHDRGSARGTGRRPGRRPHDRARIGPHPRLRSPVAARHVDHDRADSGQRHGRPRRHVRRPPACRRSLFADAIVDCGMPRDRSAFRTALTLLTYRAEGELRMRLARLALLLVVSVPVFAERYTPRIFARHRPMHPNDSQAVTFEGTAVADRVQLSYERFTLSTQPD